MIKEVVLFGIVALVGIFMFARDLMGKPGLKAVVVIHALVAVLTFVMLLFFVLS